MNGISKKLFDYIQVCSEDIDKGYFNKVYRECPKPFRNELLNLFERSGVIIPQKELDLINRKLYGIKYPGYILSVRTPRNDGSGVARCGFTQNQGMKRSGNIVFDNKKDALNFLSKLNKPNAVVYEMQESQLDKTWVPVWVETIDGNYRLPGLINQMYFDEWQNRLQRR